MDEAYTREEVIKECFQLGFKQTEMVNILRTQYGIIISIRHLRRLLCRYNLRKKDKSDIVDVASFVSQQLGSSGQQQGYRLMHLRCTLCGLSVNVHEVRELLKILDPEGVDLRSRRRLIRRRYYSKGPNYMWHMDSYDKLRPYGIAINGCIDGFSRYIVWLEANYTASDPKVIGGYFMFSVEELGGFPEFIRADRGTENVVVEQLQIFFHESKNAERPPEHFRYGRSTANQRIENWWCFLRRQCTEFWISFFQELRESGLFNGDIIEQELIRFVFTNIIQKELNDIKLLWNLHSIRRSKNEHVLHGRPVILYTSPDEYGTRDYLCRFNDRYLNACRNECTFKHPNLNTSDPDVDSVCRILMEENGWQMPLCATSGRELYGKLREKVLRLLY